MLDAGALRDTYTLAYTWDFAEDGTGTVAWTLVQAGILKAMDGSYRLDATVRDRGHVHRSASR